MGLNDWVMKQQLKAQSQLRGKFRKALEDDMRKYEKKHGHKPTVDEVVHEFEKQPLVLMGIEKTYNMTIGEIRMIVKEVLNA